MRKTIAVTAAVAMMPLFGAGSAAAGPGFAYSWLATDRTFDQCIAAANDMVSGLNYPRVQFTRYGVTGETTEETLFVNCEDTRHVSVVLIRTSRPDVGEIDALIALMQQRLAAQGR